MSVKLTDNYIDTKLKPKDKPYEMADSECKGLFLRIEKSGVKSWWCYFYTPDSSGKRTRYRFKIGTYPTYSLFGKTSSKKEDRDIRRRARILKAKADSEDLRIARQEARAATEADAVTTLRNFIDGPYLQYCTDTEITDPEKAVRWLKSAFSDLLDKRVDAITPWIIQGWINKRKKTHAPATIHRNLNGSLSGVLSLAVALGVAETNPLQASERKKNGGKGLVFPNPRTDQVIRSIKTAWGSLMKEAKLESFRFHDCRHSFASKLVQAGVPLYTVQQLLGHYSIKMTERYSHLSPDHMKDALRAVDA